MYIYIYIYIYILYIYIYIFIRYTYFLGCQMVEKPSIVGISKGSTRKIVCRSVCFNDVAG